MAEKISSFKDLGVYKLAFELQQEVFEVSKRFPAEERYALTDQVRRASRAIGGEQAETQHWLDTALACQYMSERHQKDLLGKCSRIGQMLGSMMAKPEKFCCQTS